MNHRRIDPDFDELENLLREIPTVTSGNEYSCFPISRSTPFINSAVQFEEQHFPDDFNFRNPIQTPEYPQLMLSPSYHSSNSSPCLYDNFDSRQLNPHRGGYFQNFSSGTSPSQTPDYLPSSQSYYPSLDQSQMNWRNIREGNFQRLNLQNDEYFCLSPRQELFDYRRAELSNRNLFCNGEDSDESLRSFEGVRKMFSPEKILMRSQLNVRDDSQNRRLWLQNQLNEDLVMSLNNLTLQPEKYYSLAEARGKIYLMAKDQHGCRFLQRKFDEQDETEIEMIFLEIIDCISELMIDPFGNYLVQKLLDVCNEDQRLQIVHSVARIPGLLIKISCDMHGTRVVQRIVATVKRQDEILFFMFALKHGIVTLIKDVNGHHVVQKCLNTLLPYSEKFLFQAVITHCVEIATDRHGCCVLQRFIECLEGQLKDFLVSEIAYHALLLSQDPFGNYVLQKVFELQLQWAISKILEQLEGNYTELSMQKCSSNVVERCLKLADDEYRTRIITELINHVRFDQVMLDPYGNFVVQAALKHSKGNLRCHLVESIRNHSSSLRLNTYGRKVLSALNLRK